MPMAQHLVRGGACFIAKPYKVIKEPARLFAGVPKHFQDVVTKLAGKLALKCAIHAIGDLANRVMLKYMQAC